MADESVNIVLINARTSFPADSQSKLNVARHQLKTLLRKQLSNLFILCQEFGADAKRSQLSTLLGHTHYRSPAPNDVCIYYRKCDLNSVRPLQDDELEAIVNKHKTKMIRDLCEQLRRLTFQESINSETAESETEIPTEKSILLDVVKRLHVVIFGNHLLASWHGRHDISDERKALQFKLMIELMETVLRDENSSENVMVGGDFNFPYTSAVREITSDKGIIGDTSCMGEYIVFWPKKKLQCANVEYLGGPAVNVEAQIDAEISDQHMLMYSLQWKQDVCLIL